MFQYYRNIELCYVNEIQFISLEKFHLLKMICPRKINLHFDTLVKKNTLQIGYGGTAHEVLIEAYGY